MKAEVITALQGLNPGKECFMILFKEELSGRSKFLIENGGPYYTYHEEEANQKAEKLNKEIEEKRNLMKATRNFAKIFDLDEGHVLVTKERNNDDDSESIANIKIITRFDYHGIELEPSLHIAYHSEKTRDKDFDELTEEFISGVFDKILFEESWSLLRKKQ